jgi:hypothetical protein
MMAGPVEVDPRYARNKETDSHRMDVADPSISNSSMTAQTPEEVANFHPSPEAQARVADLVEREKNARLAPDAAAELAHSVEIEHILRWPKHLPSDPPAASAIRPHQIVPGHQPDRN